MKILPNQQSSGDVKIGLRKFLTEPTLFNLSYEYFFLIIA